MRDEAQLREEPVRDYTPQTVAWITALGLLTAAGIFTLGFLIGGRMAKLDMAHEPAIDPITRLDVQRKLHDDLTFYDDLTAKQKAKPPQATATTAGGAGSKSGAASPPTSPVTSTRAAAAPPGSTLAKNSLAAATPSAPSVRAPGAGPTKNNVVKFQGLLGLQDGPARTGEYTVQVSSYQSNEEARAFCGALERKGFKPFIVKTDLGPRGTWYRVRVGRFLEEAKAKQAKQTLAQADIPSWVLRTE